MMERWNDGKWVWRVASVMMAVLTIIPTFQLSAQDYRAQAIRILKTVPLIDGHNDIPDAIRERGGLDSVNFATNQPKLMSDIPRLRRGAVGAQFWAAYVPVTTMDSGTHPRCTRSNRSISCTDRKSTRLNSSHVRISDAVVCLE